MVETVDLQITQEPCFDNLVRSIIDTKAALDEARVSVRDRWLYLDGVCSLPEVLTNERG